jgi:hypothetical protein
MTKAELIQTLIPGLVKSTSSTARDVENVLNTYETDRLQKELVRQKRAGLINSVEDIANDQVLKQIEQIRAEARREWENNPERIRQQQQQAVEDAEIYRDYALTQIFKTWVPGHGFAKRNKASEALVISWLNFDENLSVPWYLHVLAENPNLASGLQWTTKNKAQSLADDQQTFAAVAKALRSFGVTEATFNLTRSILGPDFTFTELQDRIADGSLQLSKPSQSELDQWAASDTESHNTRLLQSSATELRTLARIESEQKRTQQQINTANESFESSKQRDAAIGGFPPLPAELTKEQIKSAPPERIKYWLKRFGTHQINVRINGRN